MKTFITLLLSFIAAGKSYSQFGDGTVPNTPNPAIESFFDYNKTLGPSYGIRIGVLPRTCRLLVTLGVRFRTAYDSSLAFVGHSPSTVISSAEKPMFQIAMGYAVAQHVLHIADLCPYAGIDMRANAGDGFFGLRLMRELNHPHLIFSAYFEEMISDRSDQPLRPETGISAAYYFGF